ncbi:type II toxin-antitoxin system RelE/ParE family toxin [Methanosarcina hadiensis]|uniref:type II toxin-antitoxin system RelE family toxin n=1 Tax=Methanosarcina hadiensis TaxID=3078083 RepID=UPI003977C892
MTFDVFIKSKVLDDLPAERKKQIVEALKELQDVFQGGNKCRIEGYREDIYRFRIGNYRAFYTVDFEKKQIIVFDILTSEQAHKKYSRLD